MRILVTGAKGQLGQDVVSVFSPHHEVYAYGRDGLDITDAQATRDTVRKVAPDVVIHTAAYTAVDKAEEDEQQAYLVNATGSENVARAASEVGAKMCAISTDYVFDGASSEPYTESFTTAPRTVYGASKLAGEEQIRAYSDEFFIVRTSWVFGAHGNNFLKTMLNLGRAGKSLKVVSDQVGCPTYTKDLAVFLFQLVQSTAFGTYHASNTGRCSWYEFAREIFRQADLAVDLSPCTTEEFPRPAPRPKNSVLAHRAMVEHGFDLLRPWQDAVGACLLELDETKQSEEGP